MCNTTKNPMYHIDRETIVLDPTKWCRMLMFQSLIQKKNLPIEELPYEMKTYLFVLNIFYF